MAGKIPAATIDTRNRTSDKSRRNFHDEKHGNAAETMDACHDDWHRIDLDKQQSERGHRELDRPGDRCRLRNDDDHGDRWLRQQREHDDYRAAAVLADDVAAR